MQCHSMCGLAGDPPYIWFRNGEYVKQGMYYQHSIKAEDNFSCAVKGYEHLRSPLVYAPKTPAVKVSPTGEIEEGSSVTMSCSSDANPAAKYTWFKVNTDRSSREINQGQQLVFGAILSSDSGQYYCIVKTELRTESVSISINVKYGPKHTSVFSSPSGEIEEGSSVTLSCSSDANPAAKYTWFKEHGDSVEESGQNYTITDITFELGGNYYCQANNAIGRHNSTFLFINVTVTSPSPTSSSQTTAVAVGTIGALLATILLLVFFWMRRKRASRKAHGQGGRPDTVEEPFSVPVYDNISALTYRLAPGAQREPKEQQDDLPYANIHICHSEYQEVHHCLAGSRVQSDQTEEVFYSLVYFPSPNTVPEDRDWAEMGDDSVVYSTVYKTPQFQPVAAQRFV
ncbi:unnamed protein product [Lota lota]